MNARSLATALAVLGFSALSWQATSAFERRINIDAPRGTFAKSVEVYCFDGTCVRESQLTGVNGGSLLRSGQCKKSGDGSFTCTGKLTGPNGGLVTRDSSVTIAID